MREEVDFESFDIEEVVLCPEKDQYIIVLKYWDDLALADEFLFKEEEEEDDSNKDLEQMLVENQPLPKIGKNDFQDENFILVEEEEVPEFNPR